MKQLNIILEKLQDSKVKKQEIIIKTHCYYDLISFGFI